MTKKVDFTTQLTLRLGDNVTQTVDQRWGIGFVFKLNKYLSFNPSYFIGRRGLQTLDMSLKHRATLGTTIRIPAGKFTISDRSWFERRWREPQVEAGAIEIACSRASIPDNKKKFTCFVSGEVFYDGVCTFGPVIVLAWASVILTTSTNAGVVLYASK